jgi:hypothetical protein
MSVAKEPEGTHIATQGATMPKTATPAKAAIKRPDPAPAHVYDVAISFLVADEKIASALKSKLKGLDVFFYPHNQEELIGTNGLESMRAPFISARVNVILYRPRYGNTPWTGVELAAIQDSCLKTGYRSLVFVQLDKNDKSPAWLPDTHIRCVLGDFTIDQLVGAIMSKVQERGGVIAKPDALSAVRRVRQEADHITAREGLMRNATWIRETVHKALAEAFQQVLALVEKANKEHGFDIVAGAKSYNSVVMRSTFVSLGVGWVQPIANNVGSDPYGDCYLRIAEFSGTILIPGENGLVMHEPRKLREHKVRVDVNENLELVWADDEEQIEPDRLADHIVMILMDLISRANKGKVEPPPL